MNGGDIELVSWGLCSPTFTSLGGTTLWVIPNCSATFQSLARCTRGGTIWTILDLLLRLSVLPLPRHWHVGVSL